MREIEEWRDIEGYGGLYLVSSFGRVKSLGRWVNAKSDSVKFIKERILQPGKTTWGYLQVGLWKDGKQKIYKVHKLVANAFIPNPDNLETINHINEDKTDNRVENLEWMTNKDNKRYSSAVAVNQFTLSGEFIKTWDCIREIGYHLGFSYGNICLCCKGKRNSAYGFIWRYA